MVLLVFFACENLFTIGTVSLQQFLEDFAIDCSF